MVARLDPRRLGWGVSLVVSGAVLGALLVGPVSAHVIPEAARVAPAASLQTRSTSCPGYGFLPASSSTEWDYEGTLRQGSGFVICTPTLPSGAVVTKVQFTLQDNNSGGIAQCGLYRSSLAAATAGDYEELASVPGTPEAPEPGTVRQTDTTINHATIDDASYSYWLQCNIHGIGPQLGIFGADIIYRISSANG